MCRSTRSPQLLLRRQPPLSPPSIPLSFLPSFLPFLLSFLPAKPPLPLRLSWALLSPLSDGGTLRTLFGSLAPDSNLFVLLLWWLERYLFVSSFCGFLQWSLRNWPIYLSLPAAFFWLLLGSPCWPLVSSSALSIAGLSRSQIPTSYLPALSSTVQQPSRRIHELPS